MFNMNDTMKKISKEIVISGCNSLAVSAGVTLLAIAVLGGIGAVAEVRFDDLV